MSRAAIFTYLTIALIVFFLISQSPKKPSHHGHRHLKLRSHFNFSNTNPRHQHHDPAAFDPLVAELERQREDKEWERQYLEHSDPDHAPGFESQPDWEDGHEDYLNDEEKFNITDRLISLFPKLDANPADGFVSENELTEWHLKQNEAEIMHRTRREMDQIDKNHDSFVSFAEYEPPSWAKNTNIGYEMGWWKEAHFNASDSDGNGLLNLTEFNDFLHPADSENPNLQKWLCKEEVRERDTDKDGKISFNEFFSGLFDLLRNYEEDSSASDHSAKVLFNQLDKDGDGYLNDEELLPLIGKLHPSERYYAKQQADYIISQADNDKDGKLSLAEMIENPYVFYSSVFNDEEEYDLHDEFR